MRWRLTGRGYPQFTTRTGSKFSRLTLFGSTSSNVCRRGQNAEYLPSISTVPRLQEAREGKDPHG